AREPQCRVPADEPGWIGLPREIVLRAGLVTIPRALLRVAGHQQRPRANRGVQTTAEELLDDRRGIGIALGNRRARGEPQEDRHLQRRPPGLQRLRALAGAIDVAT